MNVCLTYLNISDETENEVEVGGRDMTIPTAITAGLTLEFGAAVYSLAEDFARCWCFIISKVWCV